MERESNDVEQMNFSIEEEDEDENMRATHKNDEKILKFLDSMDSYITLFDSLASTLAQGWIELASARHSMGAARISSTVFDLNCHGAATSVKVNLHDTAPHMKQPNFTLCKWGSYNKHSSPEDTKLDEDEVLHEKSFNSQLRRRGTYEIQEKDHESNGPTLTVEDQIQRERAKSLSVFGTLVSPKLRASQLSFESALDTLVEIANMRAAMLSANIEVQKELESNRKGQTERSC